MNRLLADSTKIALTPAKLATPACVRKRNTQKITWMHRTLAAIARQLPEQSVGPDTHRTTHTDCTGGGQINMPNSLN